MQKNTKPGLTEKELFHGNEAISITIEITKELNEKLTKTYIKAVADGKTNLTYEQFAGGFVDTGHNWFIYNALKNVFGK